MTQMLLENDVKNSLDQMDSAFTQGQTEFFDAFAKDAKIFTVDRSEPIAGREAYRSTYQQALTGATRHKEILGRNMQIVGDKAVVNQTARISENGAAVDVSQTIVYGLTEEGVKIQHFHTALIGMRENPSDPSAVRILNEKIATTMTASGVAQ
jgi:hypothetical protein